MNYMPVFSPNSLRFPIVQECSDCSRNIPQNSLFNQLYKKRLDNYLETHTFNSNMSKNPALQTISKLSEVSNDLSYCFHLIQIISEKIALISHEATVMSKQEWNEIIPELYSKTNDLSTICSKHIRNNARSKICNLARNRIKKRDHIKNRKMEYKLLKSYEFSKRKNQNRTIDMSLIQKAKVISKRRCQLETKQRAKQVLMDVENRKSEANKYLLLFNSLQELYCIRIKDNYKASTALKREINNLKMLWNNASNSYKEEKKKLNRFLHLNNNYEEWSDSCFPESANECEMHQFISIRNLWDTCAVNNIFATNLPQCWTIPNLNPSNKWKMCVRDS